MTCFSDFFSNSFLLKYPTLPRFIITGPSKRRLLFIPDIDSWTLLDKTGTSIEELIQSVDVAYLDGTFFDGSELPGRNMSKIPHPTIRSSVERFTRSLSDVERDKIRFIHLNHSNKAQDPSSEQARLVRHHGMHIAQELEHVYI